MSRSHLHLEVARRVREIRREIEPQVAALVSKQAATGGPTMAREVAVGVNVAGNVLRECLHSALNGVMPQPEEFFVDMAARVAAYVLLALPTERQDIAAMAVSKALVETVHRFQAQENGIKGEWDG